MAAVVVESNWLETFKSISRDEISFLTQIPLSRCEIFDDNISVEEDLLQQHSENAKLAEKISELRKMRMARMRSHFINQPKLETICKNWSNGFVDSGFKTFMNNYLNIECHKTDPNDLKYIMNLCGDNLTKLSIRGFTNSQIMPLIKSNCPNLEEFTFIMEEIKSEDFEDTFSNMSHLKRLTIVWKCKDPTLPMTLVKSIEQVCETLTKFKIICESEQFYPFGLPDSSIALFSQVNEQLMTTVANMKNLEHLTMCWAYGVTDEFLINLTDNAKNLRYLSVSGSRVTDKGIIALNKLNHLESFSLKAKSSKKENKFISDESIQCLFSKTIKYFDITNCTQVTSSSLIELVKHLPSLSVLYAMNTQVSLKDIVKIAELMKCRGHLLSIESSCKINDDIVQLLRESNVYFSYVSLTDDTDED